MVRNGLLLCTRGTLGAALLAVGHVALNIGRRDEAVAANVVAVSLVLRVHLFDFAFVLVDQRCR